MLHDERRGRRGRERLLALRAHKAQRGKGRRRRITEGQGDLTSEWGTHCLAAQGVYCWPPPWGVVVLLAAAVGVLPVEPTHERVLVRGKNCPRGKTVPGTVL